MPLRQMGEAVDLKAAIPNLKQRPGPNAYDDALRERLGAIGGIGAQANEHSARQAYERQQFAIQKRLQALQESQHSWQDDGHGGHGKGGSTTVKYNGKYYDIFGNQKVPISFGYGAKYSRPHSGHSHHLGTDFAAKVGTSFYAPLGGQIVDLIRSKKGFGNNIRVKFDNGTYGIFGHLSGWFDGLKVGSKFAGGSLLGYTGNTGDSSGPHLHFETRYSLYKPESAFDPSSWFGW